MKLLWKSVEFLYSIPGNLHEKIEYQPTDVRDQRAVIRKEGDHTFVR